MVGIGLAVLGLGLPTTVALMKLLPNRNGVLECPIREHEHRMADTERDVARLQEVVAGNKATLVRIEAKLDVLTSRQN